MNNLHPIRYFSASQMFRICLGEHSLRVLSRSWAPPLNSVLPYHLMITFPNKLYLLLPYHDFLPFTLTIVNLFSRRQTALVLFFHNISSLFLLFWNLFFALVSLFRNLLFHLISLFQNFLLARGSLFRNFGILNLSSRNLFLVFSFVHILR